MASLQEYLEKLTAGQLEAILARELYGQDHYPLSTLYRICAALARRDPTRGNVRDIFLEFAARYAELKQVSEQET